MSPHQIHRTRPANILSSRHAGLGDENGGLFLALAIGALLAASLVTPRTQPPETPPGDTHPTCAQASSTRPAPVSGAEDATSAEKPGTVPPAP